VSIMKRLPNVQPVVLAVFLLAVPLKADVIYQYAGNVFTYETYGADVGTALIAELDFADSLPPSGFFHLAPGWANSVVPTYWMISDGISTLTSISGTASFLNAPWVATDSGGDINSWNIQIEALSGNGYPIFESWDFGAGYGAEDYITVESPYQGWAYNTNDPGIWTEGAPTPEPSSLLLLLIPVMGVVFIRRRGMCH
jgi:hypothetical protein